MRLSAEQVAQVALDAGFRDRDAIMAVALALAASGGDASLGGAGAADLGAWQVGLWQVSVLRYPGLQKWDLTDPAIAARVAHALWTVTGGTWDWCPALNSARYLEFDVLARAAVAAPSRTAPIGDTPPVDVARSAAAAATGALTDRRLAGPPAGEPRPVDLPPHTL